MGKFGWDEIWSAGFRWVNGLSWHTCDVISGWIPMLYVAFLLIMPRCACASDLTSCWKLGSGTWNESVWQQYLDFWLAKLWKNGCVFVMCVICSPRRLVDSDPDSCKGYSVYSRLISTLVFHLYHERDVDAQEILIALLLKLKPTIHEATFVADDTATLLFVRAAHDSKFRMLHSTSCLRIDSPSISKRLVECSTDAIFHAQHARTICCRAHRRRQKLPRVWSALAYMYYDLRATTWRRWPRARCITSLFCLYTLNHNLIGVYSAGLLVCNYRNVHSCIVTSIFQQLVKFECQLLIVIMIL